jgi:hypothetical protein
MRIQWFGFAFIFSATAFAQYHGFGNPTPVFQGTFGNVIFPAGTAAIPGVTRFFPNVVFPAGNPPRLYVPGSVQDPTLLSARFGRGNGSVGNGGFVGSSGFVGNGGGFKGVRSASRSGAVVVPYAVPVYVGGYAGYSGYYDGSVPPDAGAGGPGSAAPNAIVVYPSGMPAGAPPYGGYGEAYAPPTGPAVTGPAGAGNQDQGAATSQPSFLIAFKDHTIYSAVAYWVEGDTLHYFTSGATHNQVSLSLVDRDLTLRLNAEAGNNMQLPAN